MKKIGLLTMTFVLTAVMLAACGCTNQNNSSTSAPTVLPTNEENWTTNAAASTTRATESAGTSSGTGNGGAAGNSGNSGSTGNSGNTGAGGMTTESTTDRGNGPLEDSTTEATASGGAANSGTSGNSGNSGGTGSSNG